MISSQTERCAENQAHFAFHRTIFVTTKFVITRFFIPGLALMLLAGCQVAAVQPVTPTTVAESVRAAEMVVATGNPVSIEDALPPILFQLPELDIEFRISPMIWNVVEENGNRTTQWVVPFDAAGWHVNSVGAGGAGNTILSGQQTAGDAVFAPLALGEIQLGQQILITAQDGQIYAYEVSEVSQPIPIIGATEADNKAASAYIAASEDARLTLITGWPDFSTTHRIFAVAKFVGIAKAP